MASRTRQLRQDLVSNPAGDSDAAISGVQYHILCSRMGQMINVAEKIVEFNSDTSSSQSSNEGEGCVYQVLPAIGIRPRPRKGKDSEH